MAYTQNYYLTWENGELVTADAMTAFNNSMLAQTLAITDGLAPVILNGGKVTIKENTAQVSAGYYRVANQQVGDLEIPGYFYAAEANNLTFNPGQYITARMEINSTSKYTNIITGKVIATDAPTSQDIILFQQSIIGGISEIIRSNDLQAIIPIINKGNQLLINDPEIKTLQIKPNNQQILILNISQDAEITLPDVDNGLYRLINNSKVNINLIPSNGYTVLGLAQYRITPGSCVELTPITAIKSWIFL